MLVGVEVVSLKWHLKKSLVFIYVLSLQANKDLKTLVACGNK